MDKADKFFDEIFSIFGFGVTENSSKIAAFIIWTINMALTLTVIIVYLAGGEIFVSYDALSKLTDVVQLLGPILVHLVTISLNLVNFECYRKILETRRNLDGFLKKYERNGSFAKIIWQTNFWFVMKVIFMMVVGNGIEIFLIKT